MHDKTLETRELESPVMRRENCRLYTFPNERARLGRVSSDP